MKRDGCKLGEILRNNKCIPIKDWLPFECDVPKNSRVLPIVREYLKKGLIDEDISWDEDYGAKRLQLQNIKSLHPGKGNIRKFLQELRNVGYTQIELDHPRKEAVPFWKKMYAEGLIQDNPDHLETWEAAISES